MMMMMMMMMMKLLSGPLQLLQNEAHLVDINHRITTTTTMITTICILPNRIQIENKEA